MCDFCKPDNPKILCKAELTQKYHSVIEQDVTIFCDIQGSSTLCLGYEVNGEYAVENDIRIAYCPMCGRKLV